MYSLIVIVIVFLLLLLLCPCSPRIVIIVPHRSPLVLLLFPYIIIIMSALIILWPLRLLYIETRVFLLNHSRIVHLCNVKDFSPSKRIIFKSLMYLFVCWLHNILNRCFIRNTLFEDEGFSYSLANVVIKPFVFVSFEMLNSIDTTKHNHIVLSGFLSRISHSASVILAGFFVFPLNGRYKYL